MKEANKREVKKTEQQKKHPRMLKNHMQRAKR
jgi:hypothetical protein